MLKGEDWVEVQHGQFWIDTSCTYHDNEVTESIVIVYVLVVQTSEHTSLLLELAAKIRLTRATRESFHSLPCRGLAAFDWIRVIGRNSPPQGE